MTRRILKHSLGRGSRSEFLLPEGTDILAVGVQPGDQHCIWTWEPTAAGLPRKRLAVKVAMTGGYVDGSLEFLGTHVTLDDMGAPYVAHFFLERLE